MTSRSKPVGAVADPNTTDDLTGRTAVVTGATAGIVGEAAWGLVRRGAHVTGPRGGSARARDGRPPRLARDARARR